jgi:hypothetical protein
MSPPAAGVHRWPGWLMSAAAACYATQMVNPPRFGGEWPVSSRLAKVIIGVVVFVLGVLAGAGIAMLLSPPS